MSVLLSAQSSGSFIDQATTLQQLTRTQQHPIDTFANAKKNVDAEKKRLNDLLAAQNAQKTALATKKAKIEGDIARLDAMQKKLDAQTGPKAAPATTKYGPPPAVSGPAKAVAYAWDQLGKKYVYGTAGPNTFDCSGLTMVAWKAAGVSLPHNAAQQWGRVRHITRSQLAPGDLVFYNGLGHVGIYIGNNQIIHAPNSRAPPPPPRRPPPPSLSPPAPPSHQSLPLPRPLSFPGTPKPITAGAAITGPHGQPVHAPTGQQRHVRVDLVPEPRRRRTGPPPACSTRPS